MIKKELTISINTANDTWSLSGFQVNLRPSSSSESQNMGIILSDLKRREGTNIFHGTLKPDLIRDEDGQVIDSKQTVNWDDYVVKFEVDGQEADPNLVRLAKGEGQKLGLLCFAILYPSYDADRDETKDLGGLEDKQLKKYKGILPAQIGRALSLHDQREKKLEELRPEDLLYENEELVPLHIKNQRINVIERKITRSIPGEYTRIDVSFMNPFSDVRNVRLRTFFKYSKTEEHEMNADGYTRKKMVPINQNQGGTIREINQSEVLYFGNEKPFLYCIELTDMETGFTYYLELPSETFVEDLKPEVIPVEIDAPSAQVTPSLDSDAGLPLPESTLATTEQLEIKSVKIKEGLVMVSFKHPFPGSQATIRAFFSHSVDGSDVMVPNSQFQTISEIVPRLGSDDQEQVITKTGAILSVIKDGSFVYTIEVTNTETGETRKVEIKSKDYQIQQ